MILLTHMLWGAAIASKIQNLIILIILAFLSHYLLDFLPHNEYSIKNIIEKKWRKSFFDFLKVFLDFTIGAILIYILSEKTATIFIGAFFAILPDGIKIPSIIFKNKLLKLHEKIHIKKIRFLEYKKISNFWRYAIQIAVIMISVVLLI